jgi:hypothetical protein
MHQFPIASEKLEAAHTRDIVAWYGTFDRFGNPDPDLTPTAYAKCITSEKAIKDYITKYESTVMIIFKVGDKVTLNKDSVWNDGFTSNPIGVVGVVNAVKTIDDPESGLPIQVKWSDSNRTNAYNHEDLTLIMME